MPSALGIGWNSEDWYIQSQPSDRRRMAHYIIRRGLQSIVLMWIATLIGFTVYQLAPGGPLQFLDDDPRRSVADIARLKHLYGLDRPIFVQYVTWMAGEDWFARVPGMEDWQSGRCAVNPEQLRARHPAARLRPLLPLSGRAGHQPDRANASRPPSCWPSRSLLISVVDWRSRWASSPRSTVAAGRIT